MIDKFLLRAMAESERLMDEGKIAWVWAPRPTPDGHLDRLAVSDEIMKDLELKQGQTVNSILRDAILTMTLEQIGDRLDEMREKAEETRMKDNFDFRDML